MQTISGLHAHPSDHVFIRDTSINFIFVWFVRPPKTVAFFCLLKSKIFRDCIQKTVWNLKGREHYNDRYYLHFSRFTPPRQCFFSRGVNKAISHWVLQMFAIIMNSDRKWKRVAKRQTNLWKVADVFSVFDTILTTSLWTSNQLVKCNWRFSCL